MASTSLFALLDDITALLDDIAVMSKVAAKKTAGVLGDDLALNAKQVEGIASERELPVVWAVAKGSLKNKAVLVPVAMLLSVFAPWSILPLLMVGGAFLCFEGAEKVLSLIFKHQESRESLLDIKDLVAYEKEKIKGAIRTDFILSAEITVIILSVVTNKSYPFQFGVLVLMSIVMTVFVYGLVAAIIKLDDVGFWLKSKPGALREWFGDKFIASAPKLMKVLSVVGTIAMFLVGGEFLVHGVPVVHHAIENFADSTSVGFLIKSMGNAVIGFVIGCLIVSIFHLFEIVKAKRV